TDLKLTSNPASPNTLVISAINARGVNWLSSSITHNVVSSGVSVSSILGSLDTGNDGVSLANLRLLFGNDVVIQGYLTKTGYTNSSAVTVNIALGSENSALTSFQNTWIIVTRNSPGNVTVTVKTGQSNTTLGTITANSDIEFTDIIAAIAASNATYSSGSVDATTLKSNILSQVPGYVFDNIPLSLLVGRTITFGSYTVNFVQQ
ncbi:MAG: hypothetical protein WCR27_09585, partial [Eubacteriales bacterium]